MLDDLFPNKEVQKKELYKVSKKRSVDELTDKQLVKVFKIVENMWKLTGKGGNSNADNRED